MFCFVLITAGNAFPCCRGARPVSSTADSARPRAPPLGAPLGRPAAGQGHRQIARKCAHGLGMPRPLVLMGCKPDSSLTGTALMRTGMIDDNGNWTRPWTSWVICTSLNVRSRGLWSSRRHITSQSVLYIHWGPLGVTLDKFYLWRNLSEIRVFHLDESWSVLHETYAPG